MLSNLCVSLCVCKSLCRVWVLNSGGECCWGLHTTGQNGSFYPHCDCPDIVCMCFTAGCIRQEILFTVKTESHQATARSSDHLEWYTRSLFLLFQKGRNQHRFPFSHFYFLWNKCFRKRHNYGKRNRTDNLPHSLLCCHLCMCTCICTLTDYFVRYTCSTQMSNRPISCKVVKATCKSSEWASKWG